MSYDVYFTADVGGPETVSLDSRNYTSNVSGMWRTALGGVDSLGELLDKRPKARDIEPRIRQAIAEMMESPGVFRAMEPPNGWGDYEGALDFLVWIADRCREMPDVTVEVWR